MLEEPSYSRLDLRRNVAFCARNGLNVDGTVTLVFLGLGDRLHLSNKPIDRLRREACEDWDIRANGTINNVIQPTILGMATTAAASR